MNSNDILNINKETINQNELKVILKKIKSQYVLKKIFNNIQKNKFLDIIKYNKKIQKKLNLGLIDYKNNSELFSSIEIELELVENKFGKFINFKDKEEAYFHIYINNNKEEIKRNYIEEDDEAKNIRIIIDHQVLFFKGLFQNCKCIESINFKKFYRNNINDMSLMFSECSSLKKINFSTFYNSNVTDISFMFSGCTSLEEVNLSTFKTNNLINMNNLFLMCQSLK